MKKRTIRCIKDTYKRMSRKTCMLKNVQFTRAPTPWKKNLDISELQKKRDKLRYRAHLTNISRFAIR